MNDINLLGDGGKHSANVVENAPAFVPPVPLTETVKPVEGVPAGVADAAHEWVPEFRADAVDGYTPVFNATIRTIIYVLCLIASVVALGLVTFGYAHIGGFISTACGIISAGFGVAYNPMRK